MDNNRNILLSIYLSIICLLVACQANNQAIRPEATVEILNINIDSSCYGTFEFASGTTVDDCTETYEIASDSQFIITDGSGNRITAYGPLKIEANRHVNCGKPTCIRDLE